jgi:hypothetical protein
MTALLRHKCPFSTLAEVTEALKQVVLSDRHIKPYAKALLDAKIAAVAQAAYDAVYTGDAALPRVPTFAEMEAEAKAAMSAAVGDGTWKARCKGRDVLKGFCSEVGVDYEHVRNLLIERLEKPPAALAEVMTKIIGSK